MPTEIPSLSGIVAISANHHSAAIGRRGELYFWGTGVFGTFFDPKIVVDADITEVSVGGCFGVAKDKDGLLWTWGQNSHGELGLSDFKTRLHPHPILSLKRKEIKKVACGGSFVIAIGNDKGNESNERKQSAFANESKLMNILTEKQQLLSEKQHLMSEKAIMQTRESQMMGYPSFGGADDQRVKIFSDRGFS